MSSQSSPATQPSTLPLTGRQDLQVTEGLKRGPRGNLSRFYLEKAEELQNPIYPFNYCRLNDPDWFARVQQLVLDLRNDIKRVNSTLTPAMVAHIKANIDIIEKLPVRKLFEVNPLTGRRFPDLQILGVRRDRAIELSQAMMAVTKRDPGSVRYATLGYLYAVDERMQVRLTDRAYAPYGRILIWLVNQVVERLDSPWLCWRLVGFEIDGEHNDLAGWFKDLGLKSPEITFVKPNTPGNRAELDHIRIDVCFAGGGYRLSREFYEVLLLAGITELWQCVRQ